MDIQVLNEGADQLKKVISNTRPQEAIKTAGFREISKESVIALFRAVKWKKITEKNIPIIADWFVETLGIPEMRHPRMEKTMIDLLKTAKEIAREYFAFEERGYPDFNDFWNRLSDEDKGCFLRCARWHEKKVLEALNEFEPLPPQKKSSQEITVKILSLIKSEMKKCVPEEEGVPTKEDDRNIHYWSVGFNACRQQTLGRIDEVLG